MAHLLDLHGRPLSSAAVADEPVEYTPDGWAVIGRDRSRQYETHMLIEGNLTHFREVQVVDGLVEENREMRAENAGRRHGDGMSLAARIPENVFYNRLQEPVRQQDHGYLRRWLDEHSAFKVRDKI